VIATLPPRRRTRPRVLMGIDWVLVGATLAAAIVGVVMVYAATRDKLALAGIDPRYFMKRQALYVVVGAIVMAVLALSDYRLIERFAWVLYGGLVLALLAMFTPLGSRALGATRWFQLGPIQVQPSAFGAIVLVVVAATWLVRRAEPPDTASAIGLLVVAAVPLLLVAKQPDLGSAVVMTVVLFVLLAVAGARLWLLAALVVLGGLGTLAAAKLGLLHHYQLARLTGFFRQGHSVEAVTYNVAQSKAAIGSGGLFGTGLFRGPQTNLSYVPEQQTDFIFSAIGEELGFVGSVSVLLVLGVVCWRVLDAARRAYEPFGRLLATGVFALLAFSVFENAGMSMGIMPVAGIPLPFVSYGGSATVTFFAGVGLALSVARRARLVRRSGTAALA
jgi:rod shape determining protein RodA